MAIEVDPIKRLRVLVSPAAGAFAAGALFVIILTTTFHIGAERSAWHLDVAPGLRWAFLGHALWQSFPLAILIGCLTALCTVHRRWLKIASISAVCIIVFFWLASWSVFGQIGEFLDQDSFALALASPASMLLHVVDLDPVSLVLVPLGCVLAAGAALLIARFAVRARPAWRGSALLAVLVLPLFGAGLDRVAAGYALSSSKHATDPETGTPILVGDLFEKLRRDRSDPVAHLRASLKQGVLATQISSNVDVMWPAKVAYTAGPPVRPYNVVVLVIESLRSDELASYGSRLAVMPAVDRLAKEATVFLDHYAAATHSNYSTVVPVSSQYPLRDERMHIFPQRIRYPRVLLYDVLKPFGYRTAIISSQDEAWGGMINFLASDRLDYLFHAGTYAGHKYVSEEDRGFARYAALYGRSGKVDDGETISEAIRWMSADSAAMPFMVYINLQNSHVPYPIPKRAATPFGPRQPSFRIGFQFPSDSAAVVRGVYRNALHYIDAQVGRLIDHLKNTGQWSNTIFVVVGDHGQAFYEHGFAAHANKLYEELLRTPLIIRAPGLPSELRRGLAQHVDIAPTILDLLGLPPHPGFQGASLVARPRLFAYSIVQTPIANQYAIVHGTDKLVVDARTGQTFLRDLKTDPTEQRDASAYSVEKAEWLRERLGTWHAAQIGYYASARLQARAYAPVLREHDDRLSAAQRQNSE